MPVLRTARHERFAQGLAEGKSQEDAYVSAGYSEKGARQAASKLLLRCADILLRRDQLLTEREKARCAAESEVFRDMAYDKAWIIQQAAELVQRGLQHVPVRNQKGELVYVETPDGQIAPAYTFNDRAVASGLRIIGLATGSFVMKHQHSTNALDGLPPEFVRAIRDRLDLAAQQMAVRQDPTLARLSDASVISQSRSEESKPPRARGTKRANH